MDELLNKTIKNYDFNKYFEEFREEFIETQLMKNYLSQYSESNLINFSCEFWDNPNVSITKLKKKYNIENRVKYSDILKAYPTEVYLELISKLLDINIEIDEIISNYKISYKKIEDLFISIKISGEDTYCPECLEGNKVILEVSVLNIRNKIVKVKCTNCNRYISINKLLTKKEKVEQIKIKEEKLKEFHNSIANIAQQLNDIKCCRCQSTSLKVYSNETELNYNIECEVCNESWSTIDDARLEYQKWKQRAAMMINIRAKEEALIDKALSNKNLRDVIFKKESIILEKESHDVIEYALEQSLSDPINHWKDLFDKIKNCVRVEKIILAKIIDLCENEDKEVKWSIGEDFITLINYSPQEPIIYKLIEETGILIIRKILRSLINKKLIVCCEEQNFIHIDPILIKNKKIIKQLLNPQNIDSEISQLIFKRHSYLCSHCGENGRPLKIAYLTIAKDINNLVSMIPICDICYDDVTDNEILIDGFLTIKLEDEYNDNNVKNLPINFLETMYPQLESNNIVYQSITRLQEKYRDEEIIKALTICIDRIENNQLDASINSLLNYTKGILRNSINCVDISSKLIEKYELDEWIDI